MVKSKASKRSKKSSRSNASQCEEIVQCPHIHFKSDVIDRNVLSKEQHLNLLSTPKGYRWEDAADKKEGGQGENVENLPTHLPRRVVCTGRRMRKPEKVYVHNFLAEVWTFLTPEMIDRLKGMLMNEFGMSPQEAAQLVNEQRESNIVKSSSVSLYKKPRKLKDGSVVYDSVVKLRSPNKSYCDKYPKSSIGIRNLWIRNFSDMLSEKISSYVLETMCAERTERQQEIAQTLLTRFNNILEQKASMNNPKTKTHKAMVLVADKLSLWLDKNVVLSKEAALRLKELEEKEESKRINDERRKREEEKRKQEEEKKKLEEEKKRLEEEKQKKEEDERRAAEEALKEAAPGEPGDQQPSMTDEGEELKPDYAGETETDEGETEEQPLEEPMEEKPETDGTEGEEEEGEGEPEKLEVPIEEVTEEGAEEKAVEEVTEVDEGETEELGEPVEEKPPEPSEQPEPGADEVKPPESEEGEEETGGEAESEQPLPEPTEPPEAEEEGEEELTEEGPETVPDTEREPSMAGSPQPEETPAATPIETEAESGAETGEETAPETEEEKEPAEGKDSELPGEAAMVPMEPVETGLEKEPSKLKELVESVASMIMEQDLKPTPRQEAIKDVVEKELEKALGDEDKPAIDEAAGKVGSWMDKIVHQVEKEYSAKGFTGPPVSQRPKGPIFKLRKMEDAYDVELISNTKAEVKIREARGKQASPYRTVDTSTPLKPEDLKEWAKWASDVTDMAQNWAEWIEDTVKEAEKKGDEYKKIEGGEKVKDWEQFKDKKSSDAVEWRRTKKQVDQQAEAWSKKSEKDKGTVNVQS